MSINQVYTGVLLPSESEKEYLCTMHAIRAQAWGDDLVLQHMGEIGRTYHDILTPRASPIDSLAGERLPAFLLLQAARELHSKRVELFLYLSLDPLDLS